MSLKSPALAPGFFATSAPWEAICYTAYLFHVYLVTYSPVIQPWKVSPLISKSSQERSPLPTPPLGLSPDFEKEYLPFHPFFPGMEAGGLLGSPSVQSLSHVRLFATPWTVAHQASLSITNSRSLPKLMSIESVMPSNHLILCRPILLLPSIFSSIRVASGDIFVITTDDNSCLNNFHLAEISDNKH